MPPYDFEIYRPTRAIGRMAARAEVLAVDEVIERLVQQPADTRKTSKSIFATVCAASSA